MLQRKLDPLRVRLHKERQLAAVAGDGRRASIAELFEAFDSLLRASARSRARGGGANRTIASGSMAATELRFEGHGIDFDDGGRRAPRNEARRKTVFSPIRELSFNSAEHSGVSMVRLQLHEEIVGSFVSVDDGDQGRVAKAEKCIGAGLRGIREPLTHGSGTSDPRSAPGRGTRIDRSSPCSNVIRKRSEAL